MKKATSKIKQVVGTKDHVNSFGTTIYHNLVMENGDKISIGKKKLQLVGWELSYEIEDEQSGEFMKSKSIKPEEVTGNVAQSFTQSNSNNTGLNVQNLIVAQSCISSACNLLQQSSKANSEEVLRVAEEFYKFVIAKG